MADYNVSIPNYVLEDWVKMINNGRDDEVKQEILDDYLDISENEIMEGK